MATLAYGVAGEGRGHAARVKTMVEDLRQRHKVLIFAPGVAYEFLAKAFADTDVVVQEIPGLLFHYTQRRLNFSKTIWEAGRYLFGVQTLVLWLEHQLRSHKVDLVLTDFEPSLPWAAKNCGIPFISLDHQHFLTVSDLSELPLSLRFPAGLSAPIVGAFYQGQVETIVSSFYFPPVLKQYQESVVQIGVLLREDILQLPKANYGHLLVYLRRFAPENVMQALANSPLPVRLYGLGERPSVGNITFCPVSNYHFLDDLATCHALISNAGNQLIGEAMYLGKPVFGMPETRNFEQFINAHYIASSGGGEWSRVEEFNLDRLTRFLDRCDGYQCKDIDRLHGNPLAIATVEKHLGVASSTKLTV